MTLLPYTAAHWRAFFTEAGRPELIEQLGVERPGEAQRQYRQGLCRGGRDRAGPDHRRMAGALREARHPGHRLLPIEDVPEHPHLKAVGMFQPMRPPERGRAAHGQAADPLRHDPGQHPPPPAAARRAYRRGAGRARLRRGGDRRAGRARRSSAGADAGRPSRGSPRGRSPGAGPLQTHDAGPRSARRSPGLAPARAEEHADAWPVHPAPRVSHRTAIWPPRRIPVGRMHGVAGCLVGKASDLTVPC